MQLIVNGKKQTFEDGITVDQLLTKIGVESTKVAVERNLEIISKTEFHMVALCDGDKIEIVHFIGGGNNHSNSSNIIVPNNDVLKLAGREFNSRLIIGTGKYKDYEINKQACEAAAVDMVTVAVRRVNLTDKEQPLLVDYIDPKIYTYIPNTAGCFTTSDALRTLRLAREVGGWSLVKLEILGDKKTLYPKSIETLEATELLTKEGFDVMVYCSDDPIICKRLEDLGAAAIMPLGAPIGSGLGIQNQLNIRLIVEQSSVPVIVDAGVGTASDATIAMELGCDGILMNSAIAEAQNPVLMAKAMGAAVRAGRDAYLAGRIPKRLFADASSPLSGLI